MLVARLALSALPVTLITINIKALEAPCEVAVNAVRSGSSLTRGAALRAIVCIGVTADTVLGTGST